MKINVFIIICVFNASISCSAKNNTDFPGEALIHEFVTGDTVKELGDSLWYVYQDKKNNYWFGSNGEGIFLYDGKTIVNYTEKDGLCNNHVRQIQEDKFGNMYFSTLGGISKFNRKSFTTLVPVKSKIWRSEENDLWFHMLGKRDEHGPYRYDGKILYNLEFPKHYLHDEFYKNGINPFFSPYEIYTIYEDRSGDLWFGTSVFGACLFDGHSIKWMYEKDLTIVPAGGSFGIRSIFEDKEGSFWICNTRHRYVFDFNKTAKSDRLQYQQISGIGDSIIFGGDEYIYYSYIIEDNKGDIWLTTWDKGVFQYDGKSITNYAVKDGSQDVKLVSMYKDRQGDLWLGTPENGAYKFNGSTFEKFEP
jgi:ligand-binding sensor domain-containing protein